VSDHRFSRRFFFYGSLLAGAVPAAGFGSAPSLKMLGYKSPNEKLNLAAIGAGGQPASDLRAAHAGVENVVALADVDWARGADSFRRFPEAKKYKDFRQMLDQQGKDIDAVVVGPPDHMHATAALACMQAGKHVYCEKPLTRTAWEARLLTQAAERYKVATQMGNQGYSHDATRVACEIVWSGEIGDVKEVHAWTQRASWPQEMTSIPAPTPVPETLDWDLWLGGAAARPFTAGDAAYEKFAAERSVRNGRPAARGADNFGFYLPFNWRGFYDFGSSLIGDWGVHILGPANWALQLHPQYLVSVECIRKDTLPPFTFPDELAIRYDFGPRPGGMPPVSIYWYHHKGGDAYTPPGMTLDDARKIPGEGPQVGSAAGPGRLLCRVGRKRSGGCKACRAAACHGQRLQLHHGWLEGVSGHQRPRRRRRPAAGETLGRVQAASALSVAVAWREHGIEPRRALPRLGPRLQGRSCRLLEFQHRRTVHGMARARRGGRPCRRQTDVGQREGRVQQQPGSEQVGQAGVPQGLGDPPVTHRTRRRQMSRVIRCPHEISMSGVHAARRSFFVRSGRSPCAGG
jgi:predicted dehydrogenase